ncbi:MAG TPA: class II aldolase/adducin family protein [Clostridiaceae bacterium]|jgi:L-fuculose-phosphate aldolase|nr:class II aldolase/adducin family protein [Clostridiaceae bacterium]
MMQYPSDSKAKADILKVGRYLFEKDLVAANDGNISVRVGPRVLWTTPTGVSKGELVDSELVKLDFDRNVLESGMLSASSEVAMHIRIYEERADVGGVCHAHPPAATAFAIAGIPLEPSEYPEALIALGVIPVAKYATTGTSAVPDSVAPYVKTHNACLLSNHGAVTWGRDLTEAWFRLHALEQYARIRLYLKQLGQVRELSLDEIDTLLEIRRNLGVTTGGVPQRYLDLKGE